jgi:MscS family membrane protein
MENILHHIKSNPYLFSLSIVLISMAVAFITGFLINRVLLRLARKTRTKLDDEFVINIRKPLFFSIVLVGLNFAIKPIPIAQATSSIITRSLITLGVLLWTGAVMKTGNSVLLALSRRADQHRFIQQRTLPLFDIFLKIVIVGGAAYSIFLTWKVDVTAWLASAGIIGIAIGFASKDTLANLFSGIFIVADAPYKIGDYIILDSGERGKVTDIGMRSTRILTRDDIQIIIPNAAIGAAKIVNESGGPHPKRRIRSAVGVAYGSDIDKVRRVLIEVAHNIPEVVSDPEPRVRFRTFGNSSLDFELLCWIDNPELKGKVQDMLNTTIYKYFERERIQIPFPQTDVYIKEWHAGPK